MKVCPAFRHDELNDAGHHEKPERAKASRKADHEQNGEDDLGNAVQIRERGGQGEIVGLAEDVQLELVFKQERRSRRQRQEAVLFGQPGFEEGHSQRDPKHWRRHDLSDASKPFHDISHGTLNPCDV